MQRPMVGGLEGARPPSADLDWGSYAALEAAGARIYALDVHTGHFLDEHDPALADVWFAEADEEGHHVLVGGRFASRARSGDALEGPPEEVSQDEDDAARDRARTQTILISLQLRRAGRVFRACMEDTTAAADIDAATDAYEWARATRLPPKDTRALRARCKELCEADPTHRALRRFQERSAILDWVEEYDLEPPPPWREELLREREARRETDRQNRRCYPRILLERFEAALARLGAHRTVFRPPASVEELDAAQRSLGLPFDDDLKAWFGWHDGAASGNQYPGAYRFLSLAESIAEHRCMTDLVRAGRLGEAAHAWSPRWIPLLANGFGDLLCVDAAGSFTGVRGQVLRYLHDRHDREVTFVDVLELVETTIGAIDGGALVSDDGYLEVAGDGALWRSYVDTFESPVRAYDARAR